MDNLSVNCNGLYTCKSWNCNYCFSKRVYWLREQAIQFASALAFQKTYFTTITGLKSASNASQVLRDYIALMRGSYPRCNAKLEYFSVISKHDHSDWHVHIVSNVCITGEQYHVEQVRNRKHACLYLVKNLVMSRREDYGGVRRYAASRLLNKNNMKTWYKIRACLWTIRTRLRVLEIVASILRSMGSRDINRDRRASNDITTLTDKPTTPEYRRAVERPPPKMANSALIHSFTSRSVGG